MKILRQVYLQINTGRWKDIKKFEARLTDITQLEEQKEGISKVSQRDMWDSHQVYQCMHNESPRKRGERGTEKLFMEIIAKIISNLTKDMIYKSNSGDA